VVTILKWIVVLVMPVFIVLTSARIMVNTWYPRFEYAKADFPPDPYGFTTEERLVLATVNIDFLNSRLPPAQAVQMIEALRLPGSERPLFDQYELSHMVDVKRLTDWLWVVWVIAAVVVTSGLVLLLGQRANRAHGYAAMFGGGFLTTGLLTFLIGFVLLSWRSFFVTFHDIFFPPGTWTFEFSNSLIRLFPDRFWFDAGVLLVGSALVAGAVVMAVGYILGRRERRRSPALSL
jgi:integral membrane protein (TIGR01906 family)